MTSPTTKAELLTRMRQAHEDFYALLDRIPEERMTDIAIYDNWSIKDLIAHFAWWYQSAAERISTARQGETPRVFDDFDAVNAQVLAEHRTMSIDEVRTLEAEGFATVERIVEDTEDESELFDETRYPRAGRSLVSYIIGNTYAHYEEHLPDARAWMQQNGL